MQPTLQENRQSDKFFWQALAGERIGVWAYRRIGVVAFSRRDVAARVAGREALPRDPA